VPRAGRGRGSRITSGTWNEPGLLEPRDDASEMMIHFGDEAVIGCPHLADLEIRSAHEIDRIVLVVAVGPRHIG
jgi:hypothetical protein